MPDTREDIAQKIQRERRRFFGGTASYHRREIIPGISVVYTDGVKYIMEECEAQWIMDLIASVSYLIREKHREYPGVHIFSLAVDHDTGEARAEIEGKEGDVYYEQEIPYSDFPLESLTLYIGPPYYGEGNCIVCLPEEN